MEFSSWEHGKHALRNQFGPTRWNIRIFLIRYTIKDKAHSYATFPPPNRVESVLFSPPMSSPWNDTLPPSRADASPRTSRQRQSPAATRVRSSWGGARPSETSEKADMAYSVRCLWLWSWKWLWDAPLLLVLTRLRSTLALQYQPGSNRPLRPSPPSHFTKIAQATAPHRGRRLRRRSEARCPLLLSLRGTVLSTSISLPALHYPSLPHAPPTRPSHPPCGRPQSFNTSRTYPCRQYSTSCI